MNVPHYFMMQDIPQNSKLTLAGTGPNGSSQVLHLLNIGCDYLDALNQINIISASAFAYFIYKALSCDKLNVENYLRHDKYMRKLHSASFFRATRHFSRKHWKTTALYPNSLIKDTILLLFDKGFAEKKLSEIDEHVNFWCYCSKQDKNICINSKTFPDMRVWEVINACVSILFIHGEFSYAEHSFRDAVFSPYFSQLRRDFLNDGKNHLYLNYRKTHISKNIVFLKNRETRFPLVQLILDYVMMIANIPNWRINSTHRSVLHRANYPKLPFISQVFK